MRKSRVKCDQSHHPVVARSLTPMSCRWVLPRTERSQYADPLNRGKHMNADLKMAEQYLRQAIALRKNALEMRAADPTTARNLSELADEYEGKAQQLTLKRDQEL